MSQTTEPTFGDLASAYIDTANAQAKTSDSALVSAALSHAAARFTVHVAAGNALDATQFAANRKVFMQDALKHYADYLEHHYAEYVDQFARNTGRE
ncbi:DUF3144 domain-containing protein [Asticcacaulis sp. YBE204]|uniref:DUF3144 domain-containing protein n=1 Tax=Asticcacaulis sp. YBE204 TaxID=1282363 RepID=UPI0003C3F30B|nr:DUF3144 domain-containing protein [Asticcacaulis sp. YBE204]ESQ77801.1 hypothetical protein AEYBE204_16865 [Asticcacaulis sp. YBE204]